MAQITLNSSGVASSGSLLLQTNGTTTQATVDTSGNLGLGVTPSAWSLGKAIEVGNLGSAIWSYGPTFFTTNYYYNSVDKFAGTGYALTYVQSKSGGSHSWNISTASGSAGGTATMTQAMTLDASGRLGIGVTSPTAPLTIASASTAAAVHIRGRSDGYGDVIFYSNDGATQYGFVEGGTTGLNLSAVGATSILFGTNGSERARIDSSGRFLVNTTSSVINSSVAQFVGNSTFVNTVAIQANNTNTAVAYSNLSGTATYYAAQFCNSGTSFTTQGNIAVNAASVNYNSTSDYRLKENIAPMTGALEKVAALKPCTYTWKATGENSQGFIAHELAEVVPDAVTGEKDAVDADGNPVYQGIDTSFLVATLTAALQEQQAIITQLQADVAALKGQA